MARNLITFCFNSDFYMNLFQNWRFSSAQANDGIYDCWVKNKI